jgi:hypothetical protein
VVRFCRNDHEEAMKALDKTEKAGYDASQFGFSRTGIYRLGGDTVEARKQLSRLAELKP